MARIAVYDDLLEGPIMAAQTVDRLVEQGPLASDTAAAIISARDLEKAGTPFLRDGRLSPDAKRVLVWLGRDQIEAHNGGITRQGVAEILNGDWGCPGQEAFDARDDLIASFGEAYPPPSPTV